MSRWSLVYDQFDPGREPTREALCTLGNGYFATRGAAPEARADEVHYPGTYAAGIYNRLTSDVAGRTIENESIVNQPNWLSVTFRIDDGNWFDLRDVEVLSFRQELDMRRAVLVRTVKFRDDAGRETTLSQRRLVHMDDQHLAALESTFVPGNWSGTLTVRSGLDGRVRNTGVERYRQLADRHLDVVAMDQVGDDIVELLVQTNQSRIYVAEAARNRMWSPDGALAADRQVVTEPDGYIGHDLTVDVRPGQEVTLDKVVALFTSRDRAISEPALEARKWVQRAGDFESLLDPHVLAWDHLWDRFAIAMDNGEEPAQRILHLHVFHLLQTASPHIIDLDVGAPARGLHGEAYRGHIFWDELFVFPFISLRLPALTRALLQYRHRRLPEARWSAKRAGYDGAMFPWTSGSNGREEAQRLHLNPRSGRWVPDPTRLQRHINIAVAYNAWQYWEVTGDLEFLRFYGAELIIEIARLLASLATYNRGLDRFEIRGVMGPDEFHEGYPDRDEPGIDNNAYTNVMTVWVLLRAMELLEILAPPDESEMRENLGLRREEVDHWEEISRKMKIPFHGDGIISQFEGYEKLEEFDREDYLERYGDIQRVDRILEAEGDTANRYRVSKQADVLMLFFLLSEQNLRELFDRLDYPFDDDLISRNVEYYLRRTTHGSTLSRVVHSWVLARRDRARSWDLFLEALDSDISDIQGGTTAEGIHLGAMAGTVDLAQRAYGGFVTREDALWFDPALPKELSRLAFTLHYRGHRLEVTITPERLRVASRQTGAPAIPIGINGELHDLEAGTVLQFDL
ncbi:MAG: glycoside hydrolase family 65 protein [Actinomycetota bacterium]|nr:glycoside hydrolase family 65 protein [Actinomycetota bacterium]